MMRDFQSHPRLRVAALVACGVGIAIRGLGYVGTSPKQISFVDGLIPGPLWAAIWMLCGLFIIVGVWDRGVARWAMSAGAALWSLWTLSYLVAWLFNDASRSWLTAGTMALVASLMWILAALMDSIGPPPAPAVPDDGFLPVEE